MADNEADFGTVQALVEASGWVLAAPAISQEDETGVSPSPYLG
ncbi:hypothetical protein [Leptolyngbya sp. Cla-17]|nr:hypothetical protein [Leptolyngbya sp. Cla-17]